MNQLFHIITFLSITIFSMAQETESGLYSTNDGFVKFVSDAPLEFITAESESLKGLVDPEKRTFAFRLDVNTLKGFNSPLQQEHFYENYMETDQFPTAQFSGKIIEELNMNSEAWQTIRAKGTIEIHGISQERIIKCMIRIEGDKMEVKSNFTVLLAEHNITIPKLVYQKIAEEIKVVINAIMTKQESSGSQ